MIWKARQHTIDLSERAIVMGVLNVTPDSFSDGGFWQEPGSAINRALELIEEGAGILDIGGESSRPGASSVDESEEKRRVLPVIEALTHRINIPISIDTAKPGVARAALQSGASIVNDIGGLRLPEMRAVIAQYQAGAVCMHMQGTPGTMQEAPCYADVAAEILEFFTERFHQCLDDDIAPDQLAFDPGIGFGKSLDHNLTILGQIMKFQSLGRPLVLGVSRKSFLSKLNDSADLEDRLWPTVALSAYARHHGASVLRVHDVKENLQAIRMTEAIMAFSQKRDATTPIGYTTQTA